MQAEARASGRSKFPSPHSECGSEPAKLSLKRNTSSMWVRPALKSWLISSCSDGRKVTWRGVVATPACKPECSSTHEQTTTHPKLVGMRCTRRGMCVARASGTPSPLHGRLVKRRDNRIVSVVCRIQGNLMAAPFLLLLPRYVTPKRRIIPIPRRTLDRPQRFQAALSPTRELRHKYSEHVQSYRPDSPRSKTPR